MIKLFWIIERPQGQYQGTIQKKLSYGRLETVWRGEVVGSHDEAYKETAKELRRLFDEESKDGKK